MRISISTQNIFHTLYESPSMVLTIYSILFHKYMEAYNSEVIILAMELKKIAVLYVKEIPET